MDKKAQWSLVAAAWIGVLGLLGLGWLALEKVPSFRVAEAQGPAQPGSKFLDPVTKSEVLIATDTPHVIYMGRDYYFSTAKDERGRDHKTLFLMDPELYLSGVSSYKNTPQPSSPTASVH
jgi:YHS domain-containing protein